MFCHNCGAQVAPDLQFCPNCGQPMAPAPIPVAPASWTPPAGVQSHTGRWIGEGWRLVKLDLGMYIVLALIMMLLSGIPFISGPLQAGFFIYCMKKMLNRRAEFADLFTGFNFFVHTLVASLLIGVFIFAGTLCCIIPGLVVAAMYKFTYLFIVDKRMEFWPAMEASRQLVKNDYFGFTMFLITLFLLNLAGFICCLVGLLVTVPITFAAITVAYKELVGFDQRTIEAL